MKDQSLSSTLPYRSFAPNTQGEVDLRGNGVMVGYDLHGPSPESSTLADVASASRQLAGALVHLGTGDMAQVIYHRLPAPEPPERQFPSRAAAMVDAERRAQFAAESHWITPTRLYLTHEYEAPVKSLLLAALHASNGPRRQARHELLREHALARFAAFEDAAASAVGLRRLSNLELFRDLLMCVTYHDYPAALPEPHVRLNEIIGCERFIGGLAPSINGFHLRPLCITAHPATTVPQILAVLLRHPGRMTISARFICLDPFDAQEQLRIEKRHWNREILGSIWNLVKGWFGKSAQADQDSNEQLADIDAAIAASAAGMSFGWVTITAVIRDPDPERADLRVRDLQKDCHALGIMARIEDMNAVEAIEGTRPANGSSNIRRPLMTGANFADLVLPVDHWPGLPYMDSPAFPDNTPVPLICSGTGREPFWWPTYIGQVGHQLIIGSTGTGKSGLIGALVAAYTGVPDARIVWLDLDYSSFVLAHLMGADYRDLGSPETPPINPLSFLDQEGGLEYLYGWFERLFKRWNFELNERDFEDFTDALRKAQREGTRNLAGLRALIYGGGDGRDKIRRILQHYITYWGHIFNAQDARPDTTLPLLTVYEMRNLWVLGDRAAAPAIELILQSIIFRLTGAPVWIFADEFWKFLADPVSSEWFFAAIRTLRRRNAAFVAATQSTIELANHPSRDVILESCPVKVYLPNSELTGSAYTRENYMKLGLNEHECTIIGSARPRAQYYVRTPVGSRLVTFALGDLAKNICAATSYRDVQHARRILAESPNEFFLDTWLSERVPDHEYRLPVAAEAQAAAGR
jgi:type IV secretion system protein VirB4